MSKFILTLLLSFSFSLPAFSQSLETQAQQALTQDLLQLRKALSRDIKTYHWTRLDESKTSNYHSRSEVFFKHFFAPSAARFFDNPEGGNYGEGLYSTLDPQNSKHYGNFLLEVDLKAGSLFLDFRGAEHTGLEIRESTADLLDKYCGHPVRSSDSKVFNRNNETYVSVLRNTISTTPECNELFVNSLADLQVDFIAYTWVKNGTRMYGPCTSRQETSFIIFGKTRIISQQTKTIHLTDPEYDSFLTDYSFVDTNASQEAKDITLANAEFEFGLFESEAKFSPIITSYNSRKLYMSKFKYYVHELKTHRKRATLTERSFISDYSNIEVKGYFSQFSNKDISSENQSTHYDDYFFTDQFSRLAKTPDRKLPQGMWDQFSSYTDYLTAGSSVQNTIESSRFNCRQDLYPEDNIIEFN